MDFEHNVFINCPFDDEYYPILRPMLFTILYLGYNPRLALESFDSGAPRIEKIIRLIKESKLSIHDLSRIQAKTVGEFFRLNMPFELGIDVGCRVFKKGKWANKKCLILGSEKYKYQAAISDISNSDIAIHNNEPKDTVTEITNWLDVTENLNAPGPTKIWAEFTEFMTVNYEALTKRGYSDSDIRKLPVGSLLKHMKEWVKATKGV